MGPGDLARALEGLELIEDPRVLVGLDRPDDAGIVRLDANTALVTTLDFFTPVVDDARTFGRIAATNALSDVYAMGGTPISALNIVCFPSPEMDPSILHDILAGGLDALREAGCPLVGGHSVADPELKYGLSITGIVHPDRYLSSDGAREGDALVLTKPIGTGLVGTAEKRQQASQEAIAASVRSMTTLNARASMLMMELGAHACTDVTGFGFIGHASEMVDGTALDLEILASRIPLLPETLELAAHGMRCGGLDRNREHFGRLVSLDPSVTEPMELALHDPQTSGGLLIALPADVARMLVERLTAEPDALPAAIVGHVVSGNGCIHVVG